MRGEGERDYTSVLNENIRLLFKYGTKMKKK